MADFLLELLSEEIPARMQAKACADLAALFTAELAKAGLKAEAIETYATPRRLALIARGLPLETAAVSEEIKGPRADAPVQALEGFLKKTGLTREQLVERTDAKGQAVLFAVIDKPGRATRDVLAQAIPAIVAAFPWPKSMRWGAASASTASLRWVRPLQGIVALLGDDVVDCVVDGVRVGAATLGHRFHHPGPVTIGNADDYAAKLRACHVILDPAERQAIIRDGAAALAAEAGLSVIPDEGLVAENAGLTEWPVPLLGRFDADFLSVPREVIQLTLRTNQKYFVLNDAGGALAPAFICVANIAAHDGGAAITAGNGRVLAARLSDAKFFWEQDLAIRLEDQASKLDQIVFHEKLGTVADKVDRVAKLARWLVEEGVVKPSPLRGEGGERGREAKPSAALSAADSLTQPSPSRERAFLADLAERAARLAKADLVTGMVGEFPELQGVMGGYYARAQGEPDAVADAIRDHYKPVGQGDDAPTAPVTVAVSLADKLDSLTGFFGVREFPSGSRDPFALRRAALGIIRLVEMNNLRLSLKDANTLALREYISKRVYQMTYKQASEDAGSAIRLGSDPFAVTTADYKLQVMQTPEIREFVDGFAKSERPILDFFADRLKVQQRQAGVRHDLIDAVFALGGEDDLIRLLARVKALQAFVETAEGGNLLAGYKRAANILKKEVDAPRTPAQAGVQTAVELDAGLGGGTEPAEAALHTALDAAEPAIAAAVEAEDFAAAMQALAALRAPIDAFFDQVIVNDPDRDKRAARLALLERIRAAMHKVADFSRIEG